MNMKNTASKIQDRAPATVSQAARTVHTQGGGVVRAQFVLHPSYQKLAQQIDALNNERPQVRPSEPAGELQPAAAVRQVLTRQLVLRTMARFPDGITSPQLCQEVLGRSTQALMQRLYALLAREMTNGNIEPATGRGTLRRLSARGRTLASDFETTAAREKLQVQATARQLRRTIHQTIHQRVNGVFDYARKVEQGVLTSLASRKALA